LGLVRKRRVTRNTLPSDAGVTSDSFVELARRIEAVHAQGNPFQIKLMTGASTAPGAAALA
jgi:acyl-CoA hydrolase